MVLKTYIKVNYLRLKRQTSPQDLMVGEEQCELDIDKNSFSQRVGNIWNKLPTDCVNVTSVNLFKARIENTSAKCKVVFGVCLTGSQQVIGLLVCVPS